jgi:predicted restriction endonuclease
MRKPTKTSLRRKLDKLCSEIVRARGRCVRCGSKKSLQTAHIFSRTYNATRWDLDNLLCLCASCHWFFHKNPLFLGEYVKDLYSEDKYELLKEARNQITKYMIEDLQQKLKVLEELNGKM